MAVSKENIEQSQLDDPSKDEKLNPPILENVPSEPIVARQIMETFNNDNSSKDFRTLPKKVQYLLGKEWSTQNNQEKYKTASTMNALMTKFGFSSFDSLAPQNPKKDLKNKLKKLSGHAVPAQNFNNNKEANNREPSAIVTQFNDKVQNSKENENIENIEETMMNKTNKNASCCAIQ